MALVKFYKTNCNKFFHTVITNDAEIVEIWSCPAKKKTKAWQTIVLSVIPNFLYSGDEHFSICSKQRSTISFLFTPEAFLSAIISSKISLNWPGLFLSNIPGRKRVRNGNESGKKNINQIYLKYESNYLQSWTKYWTNLAFTITILY